MKKKTAYLVGMFAVLAVGATAVASNSGVLQGKVSPSTPTFASCSLTTLFEGNVGDSTDFMDMLSDLSSGSRCPHQISANAYPVSTGSGSSYPMNVAIECSADELEVQYDTTTDSYQIECERTYGDLEFAIRANLTPMEDGTYELGVNSSTNDVDNHLYYSYSLDPDTLTIDRISMDSY